MSAGVATQGQARLHNVSNLLLDMDGVLFRGSTPLPGAAGFIDWIRARGWRFRLLTNNATATPEQNVEKLDAMGIRVGLAEVMTSAQATALYLRELNAPGLRAYVVGEVGLRKALTDAGIDLTDDPLQADWVVAGLDRHATYTSLKDACLAIEHGAGFVATNADKSFPVEDGLIPGAGALQAAIIATTGVEPVVIGKPTSRCCDSPCWSWARRLMTRRWSVTGWTRTSRRVTAPAWHPSSFSRV